MMERMKGIREANANEDKEDKTFVKVKQKLCSSFILVVVITAIIFFSACIETIPRTTVPETVKITVEKGTDTCAGWNDTMCGAIIKQKRSTERDYTCKGPEGPWREYIGDYTFDLKVGEGWSCTKNDGSVSIDLPQLKRTPSFSCYSGGDSCSDTKSVNFTYKLLAAGLKNVEYSCYRDAGWCDWDDEGYITITYWCGGTVGTLAQNAWTDCTKKCKAGACGFGWNYHSWSYVVPFNFQCKMDASTLIAEKGVASPTLTVETTTTTKNCRGPTSVSNCYYNLYCTAKVDYKTKWLCSNAQTGEAYRFVSCDVEGINTFQGGRMYLNGSVPQSELGNLLASYYTGGVSLPSTSSITGMSDVSEAMGGTTAVAETPRTEFGTMQVPFFMIGQGPSFADFEKAREKCNPFEENVINISLGPTTFDPADLKAPKGTDVCFENIDKKKHTINVVQQGLQYGYALSLSPKQKQCLSNLDVGTYTANDSNGDSMTIAITQRAEDAIFYVGSRIVPEYGVVKQGRNAIFNLSDSNEHNVTISFKDALESAFILNTSVRGASVSLTDLGEHAVRDSSTNSSAIIFVESPTDTFEYSSSGQTGSVSPKFIARPYGDDICFTSTTAIKINIYRSAEGEWTEVEKGKDITPGAICCIEKPLPGSYMVNSSDTVAIAEFYIGPRKPSATISVQEIGFIPPSSSVQPTARLCFSNPAMISRTIKVSGGDINKRITIAPFAQDCTLKIENDGIYTAKFVPDLNVSSITSVKRKAVEYIKVLALGFDPPLLQVKAGDKVCWINEDNVAHKLIDQNNILRVLDKGKSFCIESTRDLELYTMKHDTVNITSVVSSASEYAIFVTDIGIVPQMITAEYNHTLYFINKLSSPVEFTSPIDLPLTPYGLQTMSNVSFAPIELRINNADDIDHNITVTSQTGEQISAFLKPKNRTVMLLKDGGRYTITDRTERGTNETTIGIIPIDDNKPLSNLTAGQMRRWTIPDNFVAQFFLTEHLHNTTAQIFTRAPTEGVTITVFNETMDLPVQRVSGYLSSETLAKMREYADRGLVSAILPDFRNLTVKVKATSFEPSYLLAKAGSNVTWRNIDNIAHTLHITKTEYYDTCKPYDEYPQVGCQWSNAQKMCQAKLISSDACMSVGTPPTSCTLRPQYSEFEGSATCTLVGSVCSLSASNWMDDPTGVYCEHTKSETTTSLPPVILDIGKNYTIANVPRDTLFNVTGSEQGIVNVTALDVFVQVGFAGVMPQIAEIDPQSQIVFNNYGKSSSSISLIWKGSGSSPSQLSIPAYNSTTSTPGKGLWNPPGEGVLQFSTTGAAAGNGIVYSTAGQMAFNISLNRTGFNVTSIAIDKNSKICITTPEKRRLNTYKDGAFISSAIAWPSKPTPEEACTLTYGCTSQTRGIECSGTVTTENPYCTYTVTDVSLACTKTLSREFTCKAKPDKKGILCERQGNDCVFTADLNQKDLICGGSCLPRSGTGNIISCTSAGIGKCAFSYKSGQEKTSTSNVFCNVFKSAGSIVCNPTSTYSEIGCTNKPGDNTYCYLTPQPVSATLYTTESSQYCDVGKSSRQVSYDCSYSRTGSGSCCGACCGSKEEEITTSCRRSGGTITSWNCWKTKSCCTGSCKKQRDYIYTCFFHKTCWKTEYYPSSCTVKKGSSTLIPYPVSCTLENEKCAVRGSTSYTCNILQNCPCFTCGSIYPEASNIQCTAGVEGVDTCTLTSSPAIDSFLTSTTTASLTCPSGYSLVCRGGYYRCDWNKQCCYYYQCTKQTCQPPTCTTSIVSKTWQCPSGYTETSDGRCRKCSFFGCQYTNKIYTCPSGSTETPDGKCSVTTCTGGGCWTSYASPYYTCPSGYTLVGSSCLKYESKFCDKTYDYVCETNPKYVGVGCAYDSYTGQCAFVKNEALDKQGDICGKVLNGCTSKYPGFTCSYDSATGKCEVEGEGGYCWTPPATTGEGEYIIEDSATRSKLTVIVYDKHRALDISLQKSYIKPSTMLTSPGSDVCFISTDGRNHTLSVPVQIMPAGKINVNSSQYNCIHVPIGEWGVVIADPGIEGAYAASATIKSVTDTVVDVIYKLFDPEFAILRPGSSLTFMNLGTEDRIIGEALTASGVVVYSRSDGTETKSGPITNVKVTELTGNAPAVYNYFAWVRNALGYLGRSDNGTENTTVRTLTVSNEDKAGNTLPRSSGQQPVVNFVSPTPLNGTITSKDYAEINITIDEPELSEFALNWNSVDYKFYDQDLMLLLNFNDKTVLPAGNLSQTGDAINATFSMIPTENSYLYFNLSIPPHVLKEGEGDHIEYDVYWASPDAQIAFDYTLADGRTLRDSGAVDQNEISAHPAATLPYAVNKWYHRRIEIPQEHYCTNNVIAPETATPTCSHSTYDTFCSNTGKSNYGKCCTSSYCSSCRDSVQPSCSSGFTYDSQRKQCVKCPTGYTYNSATGTCDRTDWTNCTIKYFDIACEHDEKGVKNALIRNITITNVTVKDMWTIGRNETENMTKLVEEVKSQPEPAFGKVLEAVDLLNLLDRDDIEITDVVAIDDHTVNVSYKNFTSTVKKVLYSGGPFSYSEHLRNGRFVADNSKYGQYVDLRLFSFPTTKTVGEGGTAVVTCPPGTTISSYTSKYGINCPSECYDRCNEAIIGERSENCHPIDCGSCTIGATSCSVTYSNRACGCDPCYLTSKQGKLDVTCSGQVIPQSNLVPNGKYGGALNLTGLGWAGRDNVDLPTGNIVSVEAWVYPRALTSYDNTYNGIISWGERSCSPTGGNSFMLSLTNDGRPGVATWCNDYISINSNPDAKAKLNAWNHVAAVLRGKEVWLYMNGKLVAQGILSADQVPSIVSKNLAIGCADYNPTYPEGGRCINGTIDEVRVYKRALSDDEIRMHYQSEIARYNETQWRVYINATKLAKTQVEVLCGEGATNATRIDINFTLPTYTIASTLTSRFNDYGKVNLNNHLISSLTTGCYATKPDALTSAGTIDVPVGYFNLASGNNELSALVCNCGGKREINLTLMYEYVPSGWQLNNKFTIPAGGSVTLPSLSPGPHIFLDSTIPRAFKVRVKECEGSDIALIANRIGEYEKIDYAPPLNTACDAGQQEDCKKYNPYGPATIAIVTTEQGINMSNASEFACAVDQLVYIKSGCPNCTAAFYIGKTNLSELNKTLNAINQSGKLSVLDLIAQSAFFNDYTGDVCRERCAAQAQTDISNCDATRSTCIADCSGTGTEAEVEECKTGCNSRHATCIDQAVLANSTCNEGCDVCSLENVLNEKVALSKFALYNYQKPSILLEFGAREGEAASGKCSWTNESIIQAYTDFYDWWIPILSGSGIIGAAQYCYQDQCSLSPTRKDYGLYTLNGGEKAWTKAWFKEGCGNYYYKAEGLMPLTFSMKERNYSLCDPSRMFALLQQMRCALEREGVKLEMPK